jgi:hypothetical protein
MTKIKRKVLFLIFLTAFFVLTPYILLYASGYQFDWRHPFSTLMIQKTGMAIIYSEPAGANIYLNDKKQKDLSLSLSLNFNHDNSLKTPVKMKNILPGAYDLRVELPGYWPWSRRIRIYPGQITHVLDVNLFRKDLPILIAKSAAGELYPSPNHKKVLLESGELLDLKSEAVETTLASSTPASWSNDGNRVIGGGEAINLKDRSKDVSLKTVIGPEIFEAKWLSGDAGQIAYVYNGNLNRFDTDKGINYGISEKEEILDHSSRNGDILYIAKEGFSAKLKIYSTPDKKIKKEIDLPPSDGYIFADSANDLINLYDSKYKILYLIDPSSQINPLVEVVNNAKYFQWFDSSTLFFANDSEIWLLDMKNNSRRLLLRWSEGLKGIIKTKSDNYLLFHTDNSLKILTWDKGDEKLQVTEVLKLEKITSPFLSENENILYFSGKIGSQEGLYKLNLK